MKEPVTKYIYPYRVVTTYYKRKEELETGHDELVKAISLIRTIIEYRKISTLCTIKLIKGGRCIWRKSFGI